MPINLNEAQQYREMGQMMPDGVFCCVAGTIRPGGVSIPGYDPADNGLFKSGKGDSDTIYADWEFTVVHGPFANSKIWANTTLTGGQRDDRGNSKAGNITKSFFRAIVESAFGIHPNDQSPNAQAYRNIPNIRALEGIKFFIRVGIEEGGKRPDGGDYPDKNYIAKVILPGDPQYDALRAGQEVPPEPHGKRQARNSSAPAAAGAPAWQQEAAQHTQYAPPQPVQPQLPGYQQPQPQPNYAQPQPQPNYAQPQPQPNPAAAWTGQAPPPNGAAGNPYPPQPQPQQPQSNAPASGPAWINQ